MELGKIALFLLFFRLYLSEEEKIIHGMTFKAN